MEKFINEYGIPLEMKEYRNQLERIFETICQNYELSINWDGQEQTAQGQLYFLELEKKERWTRLFYGDRVATADFYDCGDQRYLIYSILSVYQQNQCSFLQTQDSDIAKNLLKNLTTEKIQTDRRVIKIKLDDFSGIDEFLEAHIENY